MLSGLSARDDDSKDVINETAREPSAVRVGQYERVPKRNLAGSQRRAHKERPADRVAQWSPFTREPRRWRGAERKRQGERVQKGRSIQVGQQRCREIGGVR